MKLLKFTYDSYNNLMLVIPSKEYSAVLSQSALHQSCSDSIKEKLKKLNELKDEQLISQEDYDQRKKEILDSL